MSYVSSYFYFLVILIFFQFSLSIFLGFWLLMNRSHFYLGNICCFELTQGDNFPHEDAEAPDVGLGSEDAEVQRLRSHPSNRKCALFSNIFWNNFNFNRTILHTNFKNGIISTSIVTWPTKISNCNIAQDSFLSNFIC